MYYQYNTIPKENSVNIFGIKNLAGAPQKIGGSPLFPKKGGHWPPLCTLPSPFEEKRNSRGIFQKMSSPTKVYSTTIPTVIPKIQQIWYQQNTNTEKTAGNTVVYNSSTFWGANHIIVQWLRLKSHLSRPPIQCQTHGSCFTTFIFCGCVYGWILTTLWLLSVALLLKGTQHHYVYLLGGGGQTTGYGASLGGSLCNTSKT